MALIDCLECGKKMSDKAKACPNCGCPLQTTQHNTLTWESDYNNQTDINQSKLSENGKETSILLPSILLVIASVILLSLLAIAFTAKTLEYPITAVLSLIWGIAFWVGSFVLYNVAKRKDKGEDTKRQKNIAFILIGLSVVLLPTVWIINRVITSIEW
jgi:uncharacterized membrane-anchored protein